MRFILKFGENLGDDALKKQLDSFSKNLRIGNYETANADNEQELLFWMFEGFVELFEREAKEVGLNSGSELSDICKDISTDTIRLMLTVLIENRYYERSLFFCYEIIELIMVLILRNNENIDNEETK